MKYCINENGEISPQAVRLLSSPEKVSAKQAVFRLINLKEQEIKFYDEKYFYGTFFRYVGY